jgi:hypothetical protein
MKRVVRYIFIILGAFALAAWAELQRYEIQRTVEGNLFYSSFPELKLRIDPSLSYVGKAEHVAPEASINPNNRDIQDSTSSYLFGQVDSQGRLREGILLRLTVVRGDPSKARNGLSAQEKAVSLDSGLVKILNDEYGYTLYSNGDLFTEEEAGILASGSTASCYLVKLLERQAGLGNKSLVQIYYFEDISSECPREQCSTCLLAVADESKRKQIIRDFDERSYLVISFMEPKKIVDETSRYVKPGDKGTKPVEEISQDRNGDGTSGSMEERLRVLKDLLDKNLITREDYEKKKAEILNGL